MSSAGLTPLHRIWRALPQGARRSAFSRLTALAAPKPDHPPPPVCGGMLVGGEIGRASGLGEGARLMFAGLEALGIPAWAFSAGAMTLGDARILPPVAPPPGAALLLHVNAPVLPAALLRLPRGLMRGRRIIGHWAWELPTVPPSWRTGAAFVHEVWAPSRFSAAALETLLPGRVRIVPYPVAVRPPCPSDLGRADFGLPADALIVLCSFSLASSFARKNPLAAIAAFRAAFGSRVDRVLIMKIGHSEHAPADLALLTQACADAPNIRFETRTLPTADSHALTACADIVLSLHRSEGFGLVPAEAMLLGRVVVATDWSGSTDFLDASCGVPIPYRLVPACDPRGVFEAPNAVWAEADTDAAAAALRDLADNPARRQALGQAAANAGRARLGTRKLAEALTAIGLTPAA